MGKMGLVLVGGMATGIFFTLFVEPAIYMLVPWSMRPLNWSRPDPLHGENLRVLRILLW